MKLTIKDLQEFQKNILSTVLKMFPDKRRLLFVHIPKTAGTDLATHLRKRYPWLAGKLSRPSETTREKLYEHLGDFLASLAKSDAIFVEGHLRLRFYLRNDLYRPQDSLFTIVRDPRDLVLSYCNYIVRRFMDDPGISKPDTIIWSNKLKLSALDNYDPRELVIRVFESDIIKPNYLCTFLGDGTAESAKEALRQHPIEIVDIADYNTWRAQRWGIIADTQLNRTAPLIRRSDLTAAHANRLERLCGEDWLLYDAIKRTQMTIPLVPRSQLPA